MAWWPDNLTDWIVIASGPLVLCAAQPADAQDHDLALACAERRLREHVVPEHEPALHQLRVVREGAEDVEDGPVAQGLADLGRQGRVGQGLYTGLLESQGMFSSRPIRTAGRSLGRG